MGLSSVRGRQKQGKSRAPSAQPCATCRAPGRAGSGAPAPWRVVRTADELPEHRALHRSIWSHLAGDVSGAHATAPSPGERPGRDVCSLVGCQQSTGAKPPLPFTPPLALPFSLSEQGGDCGWSEGEAAALLLLYDITNKSSFDNIRAWLTEIHEYAQRDVVIMLLGNKADVSSGRVIRSEDGETLAREYGVPFMETSAKTGMNVELAFLAIAKELKHRAGQRADEPSFQIRDYVESQKKRPSCCSFL
ncbi:ras-related protein Rab-37 isoform X2 [Rousettus aegyptiacus]|uniref:ras-related protein Rab-37 isoform X2 n=1 Tax=Rousettus aegyptiacus TaxID=9407 RepID=UPI00168CB25D|nr:ras-related protein Rab-37 isoform X2 [Rousettus aegyptiacus]